MLWNRKQNSWLDNRGRYLGSLFVWSEASSSMFIEICKITNHEVRAFMKLPTLTPFTRRCPRSSGRIQFALYHHHYRHYNCSWHHADCRPYSWDSWPNGTLFVASSLCLSYWTLFANYYINQEIINIQIWASCRSSTLHPMLTAKVARDRSKLKLWVNSN